MTGAGCSKWLSRAAAGDGSAGGVPSEYVEDASEPRTKLAAIFNILLTGQAWDLHDRSHFDGALARHGYSCSDRNSLIKILGIDQKVTA